MKHKTSRPQSMASAVSTAGSSASSLLYFICTETASLSRHAAQSAAGHQSSLHRVSLLLGTFFLGQIAATFLSEQDDAYTAKAKCTEAKEEDETNEWTPAEEYKERERHAHQFCGFCVLHRLSAASVCGEKEEASLVWNITPPPTPPTPTQYFQPSLNHRWFAVDTEAKGTSLLPPDECKLTFDELDTHNSSSHGINLESSPVGKEPHVTVNSRRGGRDS